MEISDPLAALNVARYQAFSPKFTERNSRQAVLAFDGDVYDGLAARTLPPSDLEWAQQHLRILSGLYGLLRPLDWMQPYRLEMGTSLQVDAARNLYQYWGSRIAQTLNRDLAADKTPVVVNLASQEYFKAVDRKVLKARRALRDQRARELCRAATTGRDWRSRPGAGICRWRPDQWPFLLLPQTPGALVATSVRTDARRRRGRPAGARSRTHAPESPQNAGCAAFSPA